MSEGYEAVSSSEGGGGVIKGLLCCGGCLVVLLVGGYFGAVHVVSGMGITTFLHIDEKYVEEYCNADLTMKNLTDNTWWPGCGPEGKYIPVKDGDFSVCKGTCIKKQRMMDLDAFNEKWGGKLVSYQSRVDKDGKTSAKTVELTGWLLLAPKHTAETPRIVLQHGFTSNSNQHRAQFFAYQLRKLGFSVLVNNFRDHCYSADTKVRINQWGHAAPYDTLGAWDYAVKDPDNVFGGPIEDKFVGVLGFSMGAFTTASLFGLEGRVPAVWVDSPPFTPKTGFYLVYLGALEGYGLGPLAPLLLDPVYAKIVEAAKAKGVDINENTPADTLPKGPDTKRQIFWVGNKDDNVVSYADGAKLKEVLDKYPKKYKLTEWHLEGECNGGTHCEDHVRIPDEYEAKMCSFWTGVFGLEESSCGLEKTSRRLQIDSIPSKADVAI